jgi:hypothetical protein
MTKEEKIIQAKSLLTTAGFTEMDYSISEQEPVLVLSPSGRAKLTEGLTLDLIELDLAIQLG